MSTAEALRLARAGHEPPPGRERPRHYRRDLPGHAAPGYARKSSA